MACDVTNYITSQKNFVSPRAQQYNTSPDNIQPSSSLPFLSPSFFPPLSSALTFYRSHSSVSFSPGNASYSLHEKLSRDNSDPACSGKEAQDPSNSKKARLVDQLSLTDLNANIFPPDYWDRPLKTSYIFR